MFSPSRSAKPAGTSLPESGPYSSTSVSVRRRLIELISRTFTCVVRTGLNFTSLKTCRLLRIDATSTSFFVSRSVATMSKCGEQCFAS